MAHQTVNVDSTKAKLTDDGHLLISDPAVVKKLKDAGVDKNKLNTQAISVGVTVGT